jgi:hypothetical protein
MVTLLELRITSNIGQPPLNRLNLSSSFHTSVTSLFFLFLGVSPFVWRFGICLSSLTQLFKRFRVSTRFAGGLLASMNLYIAEADFCLALLEFMTFISLACRIRLTCHFTAFVIALFYFLWFVLYRYATNAVHRELWNTLAFHVVRFAGILPAALANAPMGALAAGNAIGAMACKFYAPRKSDDENIDLI